jgi:hypothetical protein
MGRPGTGLIRDPTLVAVAAAMGRSAVRAAVAMLAEVSLVLQVNFAARQGEVRLVPVAHRVRISSLVAPAMVQTLAIPGEAAVAMANRLPARLQDMRTMNPRQRTIPTAFQAAHSKAVAPQERHLAALPQPEHPATASRWPPSRRVMELPSAPVPAAEWTRGPAR